MLGSRAEVPHDGLAVLRQQREAADLILRPRADVGGGDVPHVVHVEAQQCSHFRFGQKLLGARKALRAEALEIDTLLPIHSHRTERLDCHL